MDLFVSLALFSVEVEVRIPGPLLKRIHRFRTGYYGWGTQQQAVVNAA